MYLVKQNGEIHALLKADTHRKAFKVIRENFRVIFPEITEQCRQRARGDQDDPISKVLCKECVHLENGCNPLVDECLIDEDDKFEYGYLTLFDDNEELAIAFRGNLNTTSKRRFMIEELTQFFLEKEIENCEDYITLIDVNTLPVL